MYKTMFGMYFLEIPRCQCKIFCPGGIKDGRGFVRGGKTMWAPEGICPGWQKDGMGNVLGGKNDGRGFVCNLCVCGGCLGELFIFLVLFWMLESWGDLAQWYTTWLPAQRFIFDSPSNQLKLLKGDAPLYQHYKEPGLSGVVGAHHY